MEVTKNYGRPENPESVQRGSREPRGEQHADAALVSVVIPCYNQAHFLGEAIESVLAQSYQRFEIIVVDDGSTDNTSEVAARYPGVRCIRQHNQGLSAARNTGLRRSRGSHLVFLDADDLLLPEALEAGLECFNAHPGGAFVCDLYRRIAADGSFLWERQSHHVVGGCSYATLLRYNYIAMHATVMYRRAVFECVGGFDDSLSACEDYDLYLRIARKFPVHNYDKVVAEYRRHGASMSRSPALRLSTSVAALRSQRKYVKSNEDYKKAYEAGIRHWRGSYGDPLIEEVRARVREHDWKQALQDMLVLLRYYPRGLALTLLLNERRKFATRLRIRKQRLLAHEQHLQDRTEQLQKLESSLADERWEAQRLRVKSALAEERQEVQRLRERGRRSKRAWPALKTRGAKPGPAATERARLQKPEIIEERLARLVR